jgi:class 3 adenylate cyclase/tetratricopeptide (TPR) repeat protein
MMVPVMTCSSCGTPTPSGARFCPACGTSLVPAQTVEERKLVTVVFCDLIGSTAMSEALDPETVRAVQLRYFAAMRHQIELFGGTVEKFIGDAVMAVFGVPTMHEDDAHRATAAALGMLRALEALNVELVPTLGVRLRARIGANTGLAVTGTEVSGGQALVSGDTVNVAARLEQHAAEGEVLIGAMTRKALGAAGRTEVVGPLSLKGKAAPVTAYRLLSVDVDAPGLSRRFDMPFVGRAAELDALHRGLGTVATARSPRLVTVCGEPGIGKTRLLRAWRDQLGTACGFGAGRCRAYGEQGSLAPLAEAAEQLLDGAGRGQRLDEDTLSVLRAGLLLDGTPGSSLEGTCLALIRLVERFAESAPVVLVVDDCQWAEDPLLDAVDRLVNLAARIPLLVVCAGRLERLDRWRDWAPPSTHHVQLSGLTDGDCEQIAATRVEVGAHLADDLPAVIEAAGGNPFHLEQLLEAVDDGSHIGVLPPNLQSLIGARIDALAHPERAALELAAVLGRDFQPAQVLALARTGPEGAPGGPLSGGGDSDPVAAALVRLAQRRLIEPGVARPGGGELRLRFSSVLIHEVTYQAMAKRTRADRHERAADLLADSRVTGVAVAGHLERAYRYLVELGRSNQVTETLRRRAAVLLGTAGARALARSDLAWAGSLLRRAVELSRPGDPGRDTAMRQLGENRIAAGKVEEGRVLLRAVLDDTSDPVESAQAKLALVAADSDGPARAAAVARETLPVFEAARDPLGQARARIRLAQEQQFDGHHAPADELLASALAAAERCGAEPERALALGAIGVSLWRGPVPVPVAITRCHDLLAAHGGPRPVVQVTLSCPLAVLLALDERWADARVRLAQARQLADALGYVEGAMVIPVFAATVEALAGRPSVALRLLDEAADAATHARAGSLHHGVTRDTARLLVDLGRPADASARLASVDAPARLLRSDAADLDGILGRILAAQGALDEAVALAERAVAAAAATDSPLVQAVAALDQADVLQRLGLPRRAAVAARSAGRRFADKGDRPGQRRAWYLLAELGKRADTERLEG